jgi:transcriptional regulator with XRE-family HTH domain
MRSRALQLGAELREARKKADKTIVQVAEALGYHHSTISRWERGETMPTVADIGAVLVVLGITGDDRDQLVELARHDGVPDWVAPGIGKQLALLIEYERIAHRVAEINPLLIPGLLQTSAYARALMIAEGATSGQAEQWTKIRMDRQSVLTRKQRPMHYLAIIGEQALRYPPCEDAILVDQLDHLITMGARPNVTVEVLPFGRRCAPALEGRFILLEFNDNSAVVHLESQWSTTTLTNERAVRDYQRTVAAIRGRVLGEQDSAALIRKIQKEVESTL